MQNKEDFTLQNVQEAAALPSWQPMGMSKETSPRLQANKLQLMVVDRMLQ